jgi:CMP-N-acetylneuraminate monooxygenase
LTSDPWYIGFCFATGWWHINPPSEEAIEILQDSDYIYISHNHPDHLHIPSLEKYVKKIHQ